MRALIVNADDFGLHEVINAAVIEGHRQGCITSASLMCNGDAFSGAVAISRANPGLGVGLHLTLVGGGRPVAHPEEVPTLVDKNGCLPKAYPQFLRRFCARRISLSDVRTEFRYQIEAALGAGIQPTHLDSHQHLHVLPGIIDIVLELAKAFDIPALRLPAEPVFFIGGAGFKPVRMATRGGLTMFAALARRKVRAAGLLAPDNFFGMLAGGSLGEERLAQICSHLPEGVTEVMMHPGTDNMALRRRFGWPYNWEEELAAVKSHRVASLLKTLGVSLISFRELGRNV